MTLVSTREMITIANSFNVESEHGHDTMISIAQLPEFADPSKCQAIMHFHKNGKEGVRTTTFILSPEGRRVLAALLDGYDKACVAPVVKRTTKRRRHG